MNSSVNLLGIPQDRFGQEGVEAGNLVGQQLKKRGLKGQYDWSTDKITILNTSELSLESLHGILNNHLVFDDERNNEGNLQMYFFRGVHVKGYGMSISSKGVRRLLHEKDNLDYINVGPPHYPVVKRNVRHPVERKKDHFIQPNYVTSEKIKRD